MIWIDLLLCTISESYICFMVFFTAASCSLSYSFKSQQRRPQLLQYNIFCLLFLFILLFLHSWHLCWQVGFPLTVSMDPQGTIWYRLFKEDTRYTAGVHIKVKLCSLMLGWCWKVKFTMVFVHRGIHVAHWTPKYVQLSV